MILAGGASRRYGADKALAEVDGRAMALRVHDAMVAAGTDPVVVVGGDDRRLRRLGLAVVPDRWPGEGPLGGLITGLMAVDAPWVLVAACDLPRLDPAVLRRLVATPADPSVDALVPMVDGRRQTLAACYRRTLADRFVERWAAGERSVRGALDGVGVRELPVSGADAASFVDHDTPDGGGALA